MVLQCMTFEEPMVQVYISGVFLRFEGLMHLAFVQKLIRIFPWVKSVVPLW